jgi:hypothetical protein
MLQLWKLFWWDEMPACEVSIRAAAMRGLGEGRGPGVGVAAGREGGDRTGAETRVWASVRFGDEGVDGCHTKISVSPAQAAVLSIHARRLHPLLAWPNQILFGQVPSSILLNKKFHLPFVSQKICSKKCYSCY